jgi:ribosome maturation factor RimP
LHFENIFRIIIIDLIFCRRAGTKPALFCFKTGVSDIFMLTEQEITDKVGALAESFINEMGLELYDVEYSARSRMLKIFIQRPRAGVTLDDCSRVSRRLSELLDTKDFIPNSYRLEVSSPGLDRPLKKLSDYQKSAGSLAKLYLSNPLQGNKYEVQGRILEAREGSVKLQMESQEPLWLPLSQIKKARLEPEKI